MQPEPAPERGLARPPRPGQPTDPMTRERLEENLRGLLRGPDADAACTRILRWAGAYAAHLIELHARPDDRWGPK